MERNIPSLELVERVCAGERRAIARMLSRAEAGEPEAHEALDLLYGRAGRAHVVGITGVPGSGKSTLVAKLTAAALRGGRKVGIVAVDPSSPFSGGSILGDRIRMGEVAGHASVFVRSMATRGALGGLARGALEAVDILDAAGYDLIFIETVGVGQDEVDVVHAGHTIVVVSAPGLGDGVQAMKAGVLEIADVHVVSKGDKPEADSTVSELRSMLGLAPRSGGPKRAVPVIKACAPREEGITELLAAIGAHREYLLASGQYEQRRQRIRERRMLKSAEQLLHDEFQRHREGRMAGLVGELAAGTVSPPAAGKRLLAQAGMVRKSGARGSPGQGPGGALLHPEIESLDRDGLRALQARKLAALGERLSASPEWCAHFARAGMHPRDLAAADGLAHAPTLEKADLRARYPFPLLTVEVSSVARFFATSGTTGPPVMFGFTEGDLERLARQVARYLHCVGVRPGDRVYQGFGYGLWIGGPAHDLGLRELGATCFPVGPGRSELVVEWLRDLALGAATASPLFLAHLVRVARERGVDPKKDWRLRTAIVGGQAVSRAFRERLEADMPEGFRAYNNYGTTEAGGSNLANACPHSHERDEMHLINEDAVLTEILDPKTLKPVAPGEVGEIVVTTLDKEASPVVRWRTRDLARLSAKPWDCACGRRGLPLIGRIIGRSDDALKVRGVLVFPSQVEDVITGTPGTVKEAWQIYVDTMDGSPRTMTVAIECETGHPGDASRLSSTVAHSLQSRLGLKVPVECHPRGTLPRYEAKARRVLLKEER